MSVIFLDIDGVLHAARAPGSHAGMSIFEAPQMLNLKKLVECVQPMAKIVLTSNWRRFEHMKRKVDDELKKAGISDGVYDCTDIMNDTNRQTEVCYWLKKYKPSRFVIIDDINLELVSNSLSMCVARYWQTGIWTVTNRHFVCTDFIDGLDENSTRQCMRILQSVSRTW